MIFGAVFANLPRQEAGYLNRSIFERCHGFHAFLLFSEQFIGNIHSSENGDFGGRCDAGVLTDLIHAFVHESRNFLNILRFGVTLEGVLLAKYRNNYALRFPLQPLPVSCGGPNTGLPLERSTFV